MKKLVVLSASLILAPSVLMGCISTKNLAKKVYNPDKEVEEYSPRKNFDIVTYEETVESPEKYHFSEDKNHLSNQMHVLDLEEGVQYDLIECVNEEIKSESRRLDVVRVYWIKEDKEKYFVRGKLNEDEKEILKNWEEYYNNGNNRKRRI